MKNVVFAFILTLSAFYSHAQLDTIIVAPNKALVDSIAQLFSLQWVKDSVNVLSWSDSLKFKINKKFSTDSLGIKHKVDSLRQLHLPTGKYTQKLDSLSQKENQLLSEVKGKQDGLLSKSKGRIEQWQTKAKATLGLDSLQHHTGMKVPGADIPGMQGAIPNAAVGDLSIPAVPALTTGDFKDLDLSTDLDSFNKSLSFDGLDNVKDIQQNISGVSGKLDQVSSLTKGTDKAIDAAVGEVGEVNAVKEQIALKDGLEQNEFAQRAKQLEDPDAMKEQLKQEAMKEAVNHFAGKEEQLQQAMDKISKYKQKYSSVNSLSELPKRKPNEMRGKPIIERILPGIAFQIHKKNDLLIDFNPYVGYRFTGRLTSGMGWNQRVAFVKWNKYDEQAKIYGPRFYTEFRAWKGFYPRLEFEVMNTFVPPVFNHASPDAGQRQWVHATMLGLKKEYGFIKRVRGTVFVMFRLYNRQHTSPYADVLNTRFGFEFPMRKMPKEKAE